MIRIKRFLPVLLVAAASAVSALYANSLTVETDYRLRGISYTNNDFDQSSSTDAASYYSQLLKVKIGGTFAPGVDIGARLSAVGVAGSTTPFFGAPYPHTDFTPFVENAYVRLTSLGDLPLDFIAGKQDIVYGDGLIVSDNGAGMNALRLIGRVDIPIPFTTGIRIPFQGDVFTGKLTENFRNSSDYDVYGGVGTFDLKPFTAELGYFQEANYSGTLYKNTLTKSIIKQFLDFRLKRRDEFSAYTIEVVKQGGSISAGNADVSLNGLGYVAEGELTGKNTKLGNVTARAFFAVASGDSGDPNIIGSNDESFSPDLTRKYDGLERAGYGALFAATPTDSFFALPSAEYSGINTLGLGATFAPLYAWSFGVDYYLYSASQGPKGAPEASGFERLFGAEFTLGIELDLTVRFIHSKYVDTSFIYSRYTPPTSEAFWPSHDPATRYQLEVSAHF